jgi:hypothetical protein
VRDHIFASEESRKHPHAAKPVAARSEESVRRQPLLTTRFQPPDQVDELRNDLAKVSLPSALQRNEVSEPGQVRSAFGGQDGLPLPPSPSQWFYPSLPVRHSRPSVHSMPTRACRDKLSVSEQARH